MIVWLVALSCVVGVLVVEAVLAAHRENRRIRDLERDIGNMLDRIAALTRPPPNGG